MKLCTYLVYILYSAFTGFESWPLPFIIPSSSYYINIRLVGLDSQTNNHQL
jgi:hypothetical protein